MKNCVFAGSFDPVTLGHVDIIERLSEIFPTVYFLLAVNHDKVCKFSVEDRLQMMRAATEHLENVIVDYTPGYVFEYARAHNAIFARGIRDEKDFEYESVMARNNHGYAPEIATMFMVCDESMRDISSTDVRLRIEEGKTLDGLLPQSVIALITESEKNDGKL